MRISSIQKIQKQVDAEINNDVVHYMTPDEKVRYNIVSKQRDELNRKHSDVQKRLCPAYHTHNPNDCKCLIIPEICAVNKEMEPIRNELNDIFYKALNLRENTRKEKYNNLLLARQAKLKYISTNE